MSDEPLPVAALQPSRSAPRRPWILHDPNGRMIRNLQGHPRRFTSKESAERWVANNWASEQEAEAAVAFAMKETFARKRP